MVHNKALSRALSANPKSGDKVMKGNIRGITVGALLCALDIVFTRFLSVMLPPGMNFDRLSLQFLPNAMSGIMFGPLWGALICVAGDILGMTINSGGLNIMPTYTLSAATRGLIFGLFLYKKNLSYPRVLAAMAVVSIIVEICMGTAWQALYMGKAVSAVLMFKVPLRIVTTFVYSSILFGTGRAMKKAGLIQ